MSVVKWVLTKKIPSNLSSLPGTIKNSSFLFKVKNRRTYIINNWQKRLVIGILKPPLASKILNPIFVGAIQNFNGPLSLPWWYGIHNYANIVKKCQKHQISAFLMVKKTRFANLQWVFLQSMWVLWLLYKVLNVMKWILAKKYHFSVAFPGRFAL